MNSTTASNNHTMIFSVLVVMALSAVGVTFLHLPIVTNNVAIFAIAFVMAGLYMDLKSEGKLIYWIMIIPFILFGILLVLFIPDVCHFSINFLRRFF